MDIKSVETFIFLGRTNKTTSFFHDPVKPVRTRLLRSGVLRCVFALILLFTLIAVMGITDYRLLARNNVIAATYFLSLLLVPVAIKFSIRDSNRHISNIAKFAHTYTAEYEKRSRNINLSIIVAIMFVLRIFPQSVGLLLPIFCLILWSMLLHMACRQFYRIYLIKKYCPYLEYPEDRRYGDDINLER